MKTLFSILLALSLMISVNTVANATRTVCPGTDCPAGYFAYEDSKTGEWFEAGLSRTYTFNLDSDILKVGDINPGDIITTAELEINYGAGLAKWDLVVDGIYKRDDATFFSLWPGEIEFNVVSQVAADHLLNVTIANVGRIGGFQIDELSVEGCYKAVPEPATLLLLGAGLIGLAGYGRKKLS